MSMSTWFGEPHSRFFFFHGQTDDEFLLPDLSLCRFEEVLHSHLLEHGFERVLFFNGSNKLYFHDAGSRRLLRPERSRQSSRAAAAGSRIMGGPLGMRKLSRTGTDRQEAVGRTQPHRENAGSESLVFPRASDLEVVSILDHCMKDNSVKTAVIFTDGLDFIVHTEGNAQRQMAARLTRWQGLFSENRNICIFLLPGLDEEELRGIGSRYPQWQFLLSMMLGGQSRADSRLIEIGAPHEDEIESLLHYLRIKDKKPFIWQEKEDISALVGWLIRKNGINTLKGLHGILRRCPTLSSSALLELTAWRVRPRGKVKRKVGKKEDAEQRSALEYYVPSRLLPNTGRERGEFSSERLRKALSVIQCQDESIRVIVRKCIAWFGMEKKDKPLSFFFVGTSGVGKTFTVKQLGAALRSQGYGLRHVMMNEFRQEHTVANLVGSPAGYVGSESEPLLFRELKKYNGRLVLLFDEIEKAHPTILTSLMQLLDEGVLSWNRGEGDFRQCLICFTSNAVQERMVACKKDWLRRGRDVSDMAFQEQIKDILVDNRVATEVCGRINTFLVYNPLPGEAVVAIVRRETRELAKKYGLDACTVDPALLADIATQCDNSRYGIRSVKDMLMEKLGVIFARFPKVSGVLERERVDIIQDGTELQVVAVAEKNEQVSNSAEENKRAQQLLQERKRKLEFLDFTSLVKQLQKVKCQEDSLEQIVDDLKIWFAQKGKERPLSFFFVGTSGVGKSFTVKQLAQELERLGYGFSSFMMNEYRQEQTVSNLLGSPAGYVGSESEPRLFTDLKKHSGRLVILFDEIEKAHHTILTALMQLLDEGILSWSKGEGDFRQCVICFTSNAVQQRMVACKEDWLRQGRDVVEIGFQNRIRDILTDNRVAPEVCGRIDRFLVYNPLSADVIVEISCQEIVALGHKYALEVRAAAPELLVEVARQCAGSQYGARPVKQALSRMIGSALVDFRHNHPDVSACVIVPGKNGYEAVEAEPENGVDWEGAMRQALERLQKNHETGCSGPVDSFAKLPVETLPVGRKDAGGSGFTGDALSLVEPALLFIEVEGKEDGSASGFVISPDGLVITCEHVIRDAVSIRVRMRIDGRETWHGCRVLAAVPGIDIALLQLDGKGFPTVILDQSRKLPGKGTSMAILGYPLGRELDEDATYTEGTVTSIQSDEHGALVQCSAQAYPGSSGGPVFSRESGEVLGLLFGALNRSDAVGINYFRPVQYVYELFFQK